MATRNRQAGFTLIELITVVLILALLAVFAIPRYLNVLTEARKATVLGVESALQSAVALVKARAKLEGDTGAGTVTLEKGEGGTTTVNTTSQLVPAATTEGIGAAIDLRDTQGKITVTYVDPFPAPGPPTATYAATGAPGTCQTVYSGDIGVAGGVSIETTLTGC